MKLNLHYVLACLLALAAAAGQYHQAEHIQPSDDAAWGQVVDGDMHGTAPTGVDQDVAEHFSEFASEQCLQFHAGATCLVPSSFAVDFDPRLRSPYTFGQTQSHRLGYLFLSSPRAPPIV